MWCRALCSQAQKLQPNKMTKKRNTNKQTKRRERETGGDARNQKHANCVQACLQMEKCCAVLISIHLICTENYTTAHWQFQRLKCNYQLRLIGKQKSNSNYLCLKWKKCFWFFSSDFSGIFSTVLFGSGSDFLKKISRYTMGKMSLITVVILCSCFFL